MKREREVMKGVFPEGHPNREPIDIYKKDWDWNKVLPYITKRIEIIPKLLAFCTPSTIKRTIGFFSNQDNIDLLSSRISYLVNKHTIISLYYKSLAPNYRELLKTTKEVSQDLLGVNNLIARVHSKSRGQISSKEFMRQFNISFESHKAAVLPLNNYINQNLPIEFFSEISTSDEVKVNAHFKKMLGPPISYYLNLLKISQRDKEKLLGIFFSYSTFSKNDQQFYESMKSKDPFYENSPEDFHEYLRNEGKNYFSK